MTAIEITFTVKSITPTEYTGKVDTAPDGAGVSVGDTIHLLDPERWLVGNAQILVGHRGEAIKTPDGWRVTWLENLGSSDYCPERK